MCAVYGLINRLSYFFRTIYVDTDKFTVHLHNYVRHCLLYITFCICIYMPLGRYAEGVPGGDCPTEGAAGGHTEGRHHRRGWEGQNYDHLISHMSSKMIICM